MHQLRYKRKTLQSTSQMGPLTMSLSGYIHSHCIANVQVRSIVTSVEALTIIPTRTVTASTTISLSVQTDFIIVPWLLGTIILVDHQPLVSACVNNVWTFIRHLNVDGSFLLFFVCLFAWSWYCPLRFVANVK